MNTDAAYRLILSCDTTFICVKAPFLDKKCFQNFFATFEVSIWKLCAKVERKKIVSTHEKFYG